MQVAHQFRVWQKEEKEEEVKRERSTRRKSIGCQDYRLWCHQSAGSIALVDLVPPSCKREKNFSIEAELWSSYYIADDDIH